MVKTNRVFLPIDGYDPNSWPLAILCAEQINAAHAPPVSDVVLLLHQQSILAHSSLSGFMGDQIVKALRAGKPVRLPSGALLRLETKRTISHLARPTTIIAFYADDAILEIIDGLTNVAGVVAVEDLQGSANQWVARWSPLVPGQPAKPPVQLINDPVVLKALESLSGLVNKSNAVLTSSYEDWARDVLRILRAKGHFADPKDIKSWAIKDGWKPGAADDLAKLAKRTFEMKTKPSLAGIANASERYDRWCGRTP
jgi:hypothetical protein